ncbi:type III secretion system effector avirulence protein AvrBs2 [Xanthomonas translucens]|uniref:type III secretion system effector avirulence protein AvrBs2 n=2 Tax=Xanthomonas campestris pv. translucens TaxID=343 RepID=UPI000348A8B6|nr:type III secretion system effector avirulence protein AvrBs2 [Xanthomonas translucens]MBC3972924.1 glycerophosphodiester phosphodiesterase family protein [Xanthomonas translucens pv. undulosa]QEO28211.1 glycerophosphodiester phosphodiesterase family protein [Xanthomonas translucens pv. undulosa]QSQ54729.1 glycerophosphodiester phosphodiesterase family protein [Xanthomonas translucens pv. undulosa]QSQ58523.1 glycerophosphodiester phosphodiesterase family protein [Xanthomonas translucens pv. u
MRVSYPAAAAPTTTVKTAEAPFVDTATVSTPMAAAPSGLAGRPRPRLPNAGAPPLVPLPDAGGKRAPAPLVALDGDFSKDRRVEIDARQVTVHALQTRLGTLSADAGVALKPGSVAAQFAAGTLTPVYLDPPAFRAMAKSLSGQGAGRKTEPLLVDEQGQRIVFDLERAFVPGDRLSDEATSALGKALDLPAQGLKNPDWLQPAAQSRTSRRQLQKVPRYKGHEIPAQNGGAGFYKPNDHRLLGDKREVVSKQLPEFVHANYVQAESTKALGKDVMVHRGLFDTHAGIPENSLAAIEHAYAEGYRTLELDVQVSAEGVPVLLHDFAIGRTTDDSENRLATQVKYAELQDKRLVIRNPMDGNFVSTNQRIAGIEPMLDNVLRTKPGMSVVLDCKEHIAENVALMLIRRPQLRPITALKLYSVAYKGGFDEFFSNLCEKLQINPLHSQDQPRRDKLRRDLSQIKVVPLLIEDTLKDTQLRALFPAAEDTTGLADTATHWMQSWNNMRPIIAEMMIVDPDSDAGKAMQLTQERLRQPGSGYEKAAFSSAYRYEDFSIPRSGGQRDYYTWGVFGEINPVPSSGFEPQRGTAGAFRERGESVLTDQPGEEVLALREKRTLPRGHTGLELDVPPDAPLDRNRDADIVQERRKQFMEAKQPLDEVHIQAARDGARLDQGASLQLPPAARQAIDKQAEALGLLTDRYRGAPVSHYLNEQAKQTGPEE